ncbi:hypothetical protein K9M79_01425 [Candidatus Woesearchaeota archaeon]|nr:hypothetical protein [Candidatus Woesearchaeota archaeon]
METLEAKTDREELKKVKVRPLSFLMGVGVGALDAVVHPQGEGLNKLISQDPSLLQFGIFGGLTSAIIYVDNIKGGRTKENARYNAGVFFGNYTVGYAIGYSVSKIFQ